MRRVRLPGALIAVLALAALIVAGCGQRSTPLGMPEAEAFGEEVDAIVEEMLVGLSQRDYEAHARHFDEELRDQIDPIVTFPQAYDEIIGELGPYRSHELAAVEDQDLYRIATYDVVFEGDEHVTLKVVFWRNDPQHRITGLLFDSVELRGGQ